MEDKEKIDAGFSAMVEKDQAELEQAVKEYFRGHWPDTTTAEGCNTQMSFTPSAILRLARHIAGWQYQKDRREFAKLKAKEWMSGYDDAVSRFVKIPYTGERWFSTTNGEFIAGAIFEEAIPAGAEFYYKKEGKK